MIAIVAALALLLPGPVLAQTVYRCIDASGKVQFSDRLCDRTAVDAARVNARPNTLDASGEREQRLLRENEALRQQLQGGAAQAPATVGRTESDLQADRSNTYACRQAQQNLEAVASSVTARNGEARRAAEHRMRAACGMREPTQINVYQEAPQIVRRPPPPPRREPLPFVPGNYNQAAGGFTDTQGNFCPRVAGGLQCPNGFVPIN